jgi:peptidoglycan/xylan/chitin deacetylase (PgdA/CDA1 family)
VRGHLLIDVPLAATGIALAVAFGPLPLAGAAALSAAVHTWAVTDPRASLYMPVCWRLGAESAGCALTFDDGPNPEVTPRLLDRLGEAGERATFFVIGSHVRRHGALARRMLAEGHTIGLHSDSHSRMFNCWPPRRVKADLEACGAAIADATGAPAPTLFRPPVGLKNPIVGFVAGRLGLSTVTWTARGRDTRTSDPQLIAARLRPGIARGGILLLHDGHEPARPAPRDACLAVVELVLARLRELGLRSLPLTADGRGVRLAEAAAVTA